MLWIRYEEGNVERGTKKVGENKVRKGLLDIVGCIFESIGSEVNGSEVNNSVVTDSEVTGSEETNSDVNVSEVTFVSEFPSVSGC